MVYEGMMHEPAGHVAPPQRSLGTAALSAIEIFLKVFAIGVPVLYLLGRVYVEGYWGDIDLSASLMKYSAEDYVYFGFAVGLNRIFAGINGIPGGALGGLAVVAAVLAVVTTIIVVVRRWAIPLLKARIILAEQRMRTWRENEPGLILQLARPFAAMAQASYTLLFYFFLTIFVAALPIVVAVEAGKGAARKDREKLSGMLLDKPSGPGAFLHLRNESGSTQVHVLLACSPEWCVVLDRGDFVAVPSTDVRRIDHRRQSLGTGRCIPAACVQPTMDHAAIAPP
jgi:hypothetical protein